MDRITVTELEGRTLLTRTGGYLDGYDYTLNPYVGCVFGCHYCYVRAMPVARFHAGEWGTYVDVKRTVERRLDRELAAARRRGSVRIFMSSATDPYQPMEARFRVTRSVLDALIRQPEAFDFLCIQTMSPLVTADLERIRALGDKALVSITVETDLDDVRKRFSPAAPPIPLRLRALYTLREAGIRTQAAVAPVLPMSDDFGRRLADVVDDVVIDSLFTGDGANGRRSRSFRLEERYTDEERTVWWDGCPDQRAYERIARYFPKEHIFLSRDGFLPPSLRQTDS